MSIRLAAAASAQGRGDDVVRKLDARCVLFALVLSFIVTAAHFTFMVCDLLWIRTYTAGRRHV